MDLLVDVGKPDAALVNSHRRPVYTLSRDNCISTPRILPVRLAIPNVVNDGTDGVGGPAFVVRRMHSFNFGFFDGG
jgi:hypothetical protein